MKNFVNVDTRFQKSINLTLDTGDMALVNRYIPTRSSVSILKQYLTNIVRGQGEHATILIGPYGKGKSHLLLVLLALLCKSKDETAEIQKKIIEADNSTKLLFMELAEVGRPFLPVIVSSFQGDLNESFIFALQEALKKTGIRDLPLPSEYSEAVRTMESWKESYPDTYQRFEKMLEERGCTASLFKERLKKQKEAALLEFKEFYPVLTSGSVFNPMVQKEALRVYEEVNRVLCAKYGYAGIYIIFDEFSKYIEGHEAKNFAKDMKILQDMCELADSRKEEQMYLTFVAHKSIHEYVKSIDSEMIQAFRGVEGRLKEIRFVVSSQNNYELIEHALHKKEGFYTSEIQKRAEASYQLACFSHLFEKEDFNQIVAKGCYPLTPVCAYALLNISEKIGQNERTVFTFLAGNEPGSLNRIMEGRNRENLIGVEYVYDYFKNLFRETVDETYIHNESYDLYIEKKDMEKELYLQEMEDIFCDAQTEKIIRSNRLSVIMENMQKWYRSLPQYTRVSERYPQEMLYVVRNFRRLLKQTELNPREFLFEQLPNAMDSSKNHMTGLLVREMKRSMDTHFENAIEDTAKEIKKIFGAKESDSLKACLQDWYGRQQNRSKRYVLNKKIKSFMEYVGELNTNDEREIVAVLSKRLEDIYIEDWNDRLQEKFLRDITKIRQKTEAAKEDAGLENGQKEIFLKTADGAEIHKYYDADVKDSTSEFLKNMIEEALDNFGDSLETNQKVAVLAEALEKLLQ